MDDLRGRVAVITGGGSGIGRASAHSFARAGAHVVVADVNGQRATDVAEEASAMGAEAVGSECDVARVDHIAAARDLAQSRFGRVDIVMNNVGVVASGDPLNIPIESWARLIDVNLLSIVRSNEVFLPDLLEQGSGHIVNTASTAGLYPYSYDRLPYTATKAAVVAVSESLALFLRPRGIGITCLCPGPIRTNIVEQVTLHGDLSQMRAPNLKMLDPAVVGDMVVDAVRANRFLLLTHPTEVHQTLVRKANDPEAFLDEQIAEFQAGQGAR